MRNKPCARAECRNPVLPLKCGTPRKYCSPLCYHEATREQASNRGLIERRFSLSRKAVAR